MKPKWPKKISKNREEFQQNLEGGGKFFWLARIYTPAWNCSSYLQYRPIRRSNFPCSIALKKRTSMVVMNCRSWNHWRTVFRWRTITSRRNWNSAAENIIIRSVSPGRSWEIFIRSYQLERWFKLSNYYSLSVLYVWYKTKFIY